jgi:cobalamin biosynthesis protein CbiG
VRSSTLASLNVPTIVIAQNFRETTHTMASSKYGFINLGCRKAITNDTILNSVQQVVENSDLRKTMRDKMQQMDLTQGKKRVLVYINSLFDTFDEK